jgi:hypothetical protein
MSSPVHDAEACAFAAFELALASVPEGERLGFVLRHVTHLVSHATEHVALHWRGSRPPPRGAT